MKDLEPGFYHFSVKEFALRKLREGPETLSTIKRGRPDLEFLKSVPAALLVSTIFWRSAWKFRRGGYRACLLDAGHLVQNLVAAANGLGIQTMPRLRVHEGSMRELLGLGVDAAFGAAESVQSMVVWADSSAAESTAAEMDAGRIGVRCRAGTSGGAAAHRTGGAFAGVSPLRLDHGSPRGLRRTGDGAADDPPADHRNLRDAAHRAGTGNAAGEVAGLTAPSLRQVMLGRRSVTRFQRVAGLTREPLLTLNRAAFLGGSYLSHSSGWAHVGLVRPFWVIHDVRGIDPGLWYFHPPADKWWLHAPGGFQDGVGVSLHRTGAGGRCGGVCWICRRFSARSCPKRGRMPTGSPPGGGHRRAANLPLRLARWVWGAAGSDRSTIRKSGLFIDAPEGQWEPLYAVAVGTAAETQPANLPAELQPG